MCLGYFPAVVIKLPTSPLSIFEHPEADPAKLVGTYFASHMLACLLMLDNQIAVRTGPVLRGQVSLQRVLICFIIEFEFFVPSTGCQKVIQELAFFVSTSIRSYPRLEAQIAKVIAFARRTHNPVDLQAYPTNLLPATRIRALF